MKSLQKPLVTSGRRQSGMALITGLILMVILTLITIAAMRTTTLEELMARNARDRDLAFQAAEAALRAGEDELNTGVPPALAPNTGRTDRITDGTRPEYWTGTHPWATQSIAAWQPAGTSAAPRYVIEFLGTSTSGGGSLGHGAVPDRGIYRITARGVGSSANTFVILQSVYEM